MRAPTIEFQLQLQLSTCSSSVDLEVNPRYLIWSSSSRSLALESQLNFFEDSGLEEAASHDTDHDTRPRSWSSIYTRAKTLPLNCFPYQTCWSLGKIAVFKNNYKPLIFLRSYFYRAPEAPPLLVFTRTRGRITGPWENHCSLGCAVKSLDPGKIIFLEEHQIF